MKKEKKESRTLEVWRRFRKNHAAVIGLVFVVILCASSLCADLIVPYRAAIEQNSSIRLQGPGEGHPFGTDEFGRDLFARVLHGSRRSLALGLLTTVLALSIGCVLGAVCGYYKGRVDSIIMRLCDTLMCVPSLLFALAIVASLGPSMKNLLIAITVSSVPGYIRVIRSVVLGIVSQDYIDAALVCGTRDGAIIRRHILPNAMGPIIVQASMSVAGMMLTAAGLSFIGMGVQPPTPEWGVMLSSAREHMRTAPHLLYFPGAAIALSALSLNLIGDGLRDALDPRLKQ